MLLLHLSDLHFGPHGRFASRDMRVLGQRFAAAVNQARAELRIEEEVALVVVTGDIAEAARPREYVDAGRFFEFLAGALGLARRYFVFVPGNHDVSWNETKKVVLDQDDESFDDKVRDQKIEAIKFRQFEAFRHAFYGHDDNHVAQPIGYGAHLHNFDDLGVSVAALNSCERESHLHRGGFLSQEQAQALMGQWHGEETDHWIKIIAVHHNPVATVPEGVRSWIEYLKTKGDCGITGDLLEHFAADTAGFEGRERLQAIARDCHVQLVLHGHHHAADSQAWNWMRGPTGQTQVLSSGSWGLLPDKLPDGQPAMMHLLHLDPHRGQMRSILRVYEPRARAEGVVELGTFVADSVNPAGATLQLSLPTRAKCENLRQLEEGVLKRATDRLTDFEHELRRALGCKFDRWDLGGIGAALGPGACRVGEARLDDMYLPLRLGTEWNPWSPPEGAILEPEAVLARRRPLVIRGAAGSGKTTWMRWTFRRLVSLGGALPFLIELRYLAREWAREGVKGEDRTLEAYLRTWVAEANVSGWQDALTLMLSSKTGPRPVLMVDGWDELGELGDELRVKLQQFLKRYPRTIALVSSRPYGQSRPSQSDGYEVLDIQPLSDGELREFAIRFFRQVHGTDIGAAERATTDFLEVFGGSPEARSLARTPLLLTMMLIVSRDRPLPDRRHKLYEECLRSLLSARPAKKEREGAQIGEQQWRPDNSEERLRVAAELAYRVQTTAFTHHFDVARHLDDFNHRDMQQGLIVRTRDDLDRLLPRTWSQPQRHGFILWLVASAGVMVDRADGTYTFTHLSFQEYLTAHYLAATVEGTAERIKLCHEWMANLQWWETLRLWAAVVDDVHPPNLLPVLKNLLAGQPAGFWLAGAMLADGVGTSIFDSFIEGLKARFHTGEWRYAELSGRAWAASRQQQRRAALGACWSDIVATLRWLPAAIAADWKETARLAAAPTADVLDILQKTPRSAHEVGRRRVLAGLNPVWPLDPEELILLRLWPGHRVQAGLRLQNLIALGGSSFLHSLAKHVLIPPVETKETRAFARVFAWHFAGFLRRYLADYLVMDLAPYFARYFARYFAKNAGVDFAQLLMQNNALDFARYWSPRFARSSIKSLLREPERHLPRDIAQHWELPDMPWVADFVVTESTSFGRAGPRAVIAESPTLATPLLKHFEAYCQQSLHPDEDPKNLPKFSPDTDPLWPALARLLIRQATAGDWSLLEDLAKHPEKRAPPLSWGLKYLVRGDIILDDGSEITLDALSDKLGFPRLPYVEELPEELDPTWKDGDPFEVR